MLDKSFLEKVEEMVLRGTDDLIVKTDDGTEFSVLPLHRIDRNPVEVEDVREPKVLVIGSLKSLVEYIEANPDGLTIEETVLHIVSPTEVVLYGTLVDESQQRLKYIAAVITPASAVISSRAEYSHSSSRGGGEELPAFGFTRWLDPETFIIGLQALFADTEDKTKLLQLMSNVGSSAEVKVADDSISQTTTAKVGTIRVAEVTVPNPVSLAPYRTFREITQPSSPFVFRLRADAGTAVKASLYEADGGEWRSDAIEDIKQYFAKEINGATPTIIG